MAETITQECVINLGVMANCGEPESYWAWGHWPQEVFTETLKNSHNIIGYHAFIPDFVKVKHWYQRDEPTDGPEGWIIHNRQQDPADGFEPVTFVYWDECEEL